MNKKLYKAIIVILYLLAFFIFSFFIKVRLTPNVYIHLDYRLILLFLACIFIYINGYLLIKYFNCSKRILKINLIIYFIVYVVTICTLTLFDEIFGRQGLVIVNWNKQLLDLYMRYSFNIIPFRTINLFISGYINGIVSFKSFCINIIGNLCLFMPFSLFLPLIFKSMNKYIRFLITLIFIVIVIELLQFITISGSCDIDDVLLNVFGASIVYFLLNIRCIKKGIHKIFLFE